MEKFSKTSIIIAFYLKSQVFLRECDPETFFLADLIVSKSQRRSDFSLQDILNKSIISARPI